MANVAVMPRIATHHAYRIAWGAALIFYFFEYVSRSAPAVMIPELTGAYAIDAVGVATNRIAATAKHATPSATQNPLQSKTPWTSGPTAICPAEPPSMPKH